MLKNKGPKIDPCSAPNTIYSQELNDMSTFVLYLLSNCEWLLMPQ